MRSRAHRPAVTDQGSVVTLEDSEFREIEGGRLSSRIDGWSVEKIKRMGGDAVKLLAWYRPDADKSTNAHQRVFVKRIGEACLRCDLPFLLELLVYPLARDAYPTAGYVEMRGKKADDVLRSVEEFARPDYGVDVFKLESPLAADRVPGIGGDDWQAVQAAFDEMGRIAGRPRVMLSAGAGKAQFRNILNHAYRAGASGYLAGRAIWLDAFGHFPDWTRMRAELSRGAAAYMREINGLTDRDAAPSASHACCGEVGAFFRPRDQSFRHSYPGF